MGEAQIHHGLTLAQFGLAAITAAALCFIPAPYGRHRREGWGPRLPARLGWVVMESPAVVYFLWVFLRGDHGAETVPLVLLALWQFHYVHRAFVFPFRMRAKGKSMPVIIVLLALAFNGLNAYLNARWISHFGNYPIGWLADSRFVLGAALFAAGFWINYTSDRKLLGLRRPGESGYRIPHGGLYRFVSCPNYLGEIVEWTGFAIACWSLPGLAFAVYTAANVAPRAFAHHRWYREQFEDYPPDRKALLPFVA